MNITNPPMQVSTKLGSGRIEERLHSVHYLDGGLHGGFYARRGSKPFEERIEYYAWPILYSKRHGVVLQKGKVVLQSTVEKEKL